MKNLSILIIILITLLSACDPELKEFKPDAGDADFTIYISLGCSKTAGFANNELYRFGQIVSYPNILSRQMLHAGGGEFRQPLMKDETGFGNRLVLTYAADCHGDSIIFPAAEGSMPDDGNSANIFETEGPFHNFGVPRAKIAHLIHPVNAAGNPFQTFFGRFTSSNDATLLSDAMQTQATFFTLWIGLSDITEYAQTGGMAHPMIEPLQFDSIFTHIVSQLSAMAGYGVVANIPDILGFPFFNHIKPEGLWVTDTLAPGGKRPVSSAEKVLYRAYDAINCQGMGQEHFPIPENLFLSEQQVSHIKNTTAAFNQIIKTKAAQFNLGFADLNQLYSVMENGMNFDGISFSSEFISGGFFSLDGINLSRRGNAIVANTFIDVINSSYNSSIPKVSVTQYQGVEYP